VKVVFTRGHRRAAAAGQDAQASVRGVKLQIRPASYLRAMRIDPHDAVTILGSLIDNVVDPNGCARQRRGVDVEARIDEAPRLHGPGLPR
jgi:sensor histidine kinase regulating citrate/malate metabolism